MDSFLRVQSVSKIFNRGEAGESFGLKDINLQINKGEFIVISGPSGSGKTTLLNLIGGLDSISSGKIIFNGIDISSLNETELSDLRRDKIGFVFQAYNLISLFSARENIEYVMKLRGFSQNECDMRVDEVARKLGIVKLLDKLPANLSGGEQQRVAVARAVASKPELILADEPTANLDSRSALELMDMMERLNREEGITVIFSSHDPMVIDKAKRSIILKDGHSLIDSF
jgi:putative ABC transport system ATP-binding protein